MFYPHAMLNVRSRIAIASNGEATPRLPQRDTGRSLFDEAGQGAAARKPAKSSRSPQRNLNSGFDLAKSLAGAKNLAEIVELQTAYWQKQIDALTAQAEEVRALATKVAADLVEPTKAHMTRSMDDVSKTS